MVSMHQRAALSAFQKGVNTVADTFNPFKTVDNRHLFNLFALRPTSVTQFDSDLVSVVRKASRRVNSKSLALFMSDLFSADVYYNKMICVEFAFPNVLDSSLQTEYLTLSSTHMNHINRDGNQGAVMFNREEGLASTPRDLLLAFSPKICLVCGDFTNFNDNSLSIKVLVEFSDGFSLSMSEFIERETVSELLNDPHSYFFARVWSEIRKQHEKSWSIDEARTQLKRTSAVYISVANSRESITDMSRLEGKLVALDVITTKHDVSSIFQPSAHALFLNGRITVAVPHRQYLPAPDVFPTASPELPEPTTVAPTREPKRELLATGLDGLDLIIAIDEFPFGTLHSFFLQVFGAQYPTVGSVPADGIPFTEESLQDLNDRRLTVMRSAASKNVTDFSSINYIGQIDQLRTLRASKRIGAVSHSLLDFIRDANVVIDHRRDEAVAPVRAHNPLLAPPVATSVIPSNGKTRMFAYNDNLYVIDDNMVFWVTKDNLVFEMLLDTDGYLALSVYDQHEVFNFKFDRPTSDVVLGMASRSYLGRELDMYYQMIDWSGVKNIALSSIVSTSGLLMMSSNLNRLSATHVFHFTMKLQMMLALVAIIAPDELLDLGVTIVHTTKKIVNDVNTLLKGGYAGLGLVILGGIVTQSVFSNMVTGSTQPSKKKTTKIIIIEKYKKVTFYSLRDFWLSCWTFDSR
jgi:hypothetical protein